MVLAVVPPLARSRGDIGRGDAGREDERGEVNFREAGGGEAGICGRRWGTSRARGGHGGMTNPPFSAQPAVPLVAPPSSPASWNSCDSPRTFSTALVDHAGRLVPSQ
mmetsp:Transcript_111410/g.355522  ORF Transcript_111410/g.355522 Transcript_111410/m.355522 type:complete len:107 (+) Transcript_111410:320-640(+)